jgi:predicted aconitase
MVLTLSDDENAMLAGARGDVLKWALGTQAAVGRFFQAERMVAVSCAHMMGDMEVMGESGFAFLRRVADGEARVVIPTTTNARCVDFEHSTLLKQDPGLVSREAELIGLIRSLGVVRTDTCVNYQTVYQPHFAEHVAWGDTGTVIYANSVLGARSNFESGPAALAAALTGRTPEYGFHLDRHRRGTLLVNLRFRPKDVADWGAVGAVVGRQVNDYVDVPVFDGAGHVDIDGDGLKHLGASLASYGSLGMFHMIGVTPEAPTVAAAFDGRVPDQVIDVDQAAVDAVYASYPAEAGKVDVVTMTGPQLSVFEIRRVAEALAGRSVSPGTRLILTTNVQNKAAARELGYVDAIERAGGLVLTGVCLYLMALGEMRERNGWRQLVTNSAKVANIVGGYRLHPVLRRTEDCIEAAVSGRIDA